MPNNKKKQNKGESRSAPGDAGECETNTGQPTKGPRKPQCPDGYADEQPNDKMVEEKKSPKK